MNSWFCIAAIACLACTACSHREPDSHDGDSHDHDHEHAEAGVTFSADHGLQVSAETAQFIGLKVARAEIQPLKSEFRFVVQVFRSAVDARQSSLNAAGSGAVLASGDVSPEDARALHRGQAVTVHRDDGTSLPGQVTEIHAHTDKATVEHFDVTVAVEDRHAGLASGAFVNVVVPLDTREPVTTIPRSALLKTAEGSFVYKVNGEHFVRTAVKTGLANPAAIQITEGLKPGDQVVTAALNTLWMAELQSIRGGESCADGH